MTKSQLMAENDKTHGDFNVCTDMLLLWGPIQILCLAEDEEYV